MRNLTGLVLGLLLLCVPVAVSPRADAPKIVEFGSTFREPLGGIVLGSDGAIWARECNGVARLTRYGSVSEYRIPYDGEADCRTQETASGIGALLGGVWIDGGASVLRFAAGSIRAYAWTGPIGGDPLIPAGAATHYVDEHYLSALSSASGGSVLAFAQLKSEPGMLTGGEIVRFLPDGSVRHLATVERHGYVTQVGAVAQGPDGSVWFTEPAANRVARVTPDLVLHEYRDGIPMGASPLGIAIDTDGTAWFSDATRSTIEHIALDGTVLAVYGNGLSPTNAPGGPVITSDGAIWFRETMAWHPRVARLGPDGTLTEYGDPFGGYAGTLQVSGNGVMGIAASAPYRGFEDRRAVRLDPDGSTHSVGTAGCLMASSNFACLPSLRPRGTLQYRASAPQSAAIGPDGNLWFTDQYQSAIGRIDKSGNLTYFTRGLTRWNSGPQYITVGPDGALWFTEMRDRVGRITLDGHITEFTGILPHRCFPGGIVAGRDGNLWFTIYHGNELVRLTTRGVMTRFRHGIYPSRGNDSYVPDSVPFADSQGRIWFNEPQGGRIARATPA